MSNLNPNFNQLDTFIRQRMAATRAPGFAAAFFDSEQIVRVATFGNADVEAQHPVTPETLFAIGSITKSFTAVAVMRAVDEGLLELHRPVTDYLPWFVVQTRHDPITIHHLLTHTSGLIGVIDRAPDIRAAVWALRETEAAWPPGSRFAYSDAGYQLLTLILEAVYKQPFADVIRTKILQPLGMAASEPVLTHAIRPRMAKGYQGLYDDRPFHTSHPLVPAPWIEVSSGDCSIASTAADLAAFGQMLLNRGMGPHGQLLSLASYDLLTHQHVDAGWCEYGYGMIRQEYDDVSYIGHAGGIPGYAAEVICDVASSCGVALLSTTPHLSGLFWPLMRSWRTVHLGQPFDAVALFNPDPFAIDNAADYGGVYQSVASDGATMALTVIAEGNSLYLQHKGELIALESRGTDRFYVNHTDFDRSLLCFGRSAADDGVERVVEAMHGTRWYAGEGYRGALEFAHPTEWRQYIGHYRAHIPWQTNFRIIVRKGMLLLVWPDGNEDRLHPWREHGFYVADEAASERIEFSQFVDGQALCATYAQGDYYRFFVA